MLRQFYVGSTGMSALEKDMVTITNNVSNSKTVGYKSTRTDMENIFPLVLDKAIQRRDGVTTPSDIELGSGVRVVATPKDFTQGAIAVTNNEFDIAINGQGLYMFRTLGGEMAYSRAGNLGMDSTGQLVDPNGNILEPGIVVPENTNTVRVSSDGFVFVTLDKETEERLIGRVELANFINPSGLESVGNNLYKETMSSGQPIIGYPGDQNFGTLAQYSLESSNVDIIGEMVEMVITQRAFDVVTKAIQAGENMLKAAGEIARS